MSDSIELRIVNVTGLHTDTEVTNAKGKRLSDIIDEVLPSRFYVNGEEVDPEDIVLAGGESVVVVQTPGGWSLLVGFLISTALSYAIGLLFKPKPPKIDEERNDSTAYSLNVQNNRFRRGDAIPLIYGNVRVYPSLVAQPHYRYEDNEEYVYMLLCVGLGDVRLRQLMVADTPVEDLAPGSFGYKLLNREDYRGKLDQVDPNGHWVELVSESADVRNLEVRGGQGAETWYTAMSGDTIRIYKTRGKWPEMTSLKPDMPFIVHTAEHSENVGEYVIVSATSNPDDDHVEVKVKNPDDTVPDFTPEPPGGWHDIAPEDCDNAKLQIFRSRQCGILGENCPWGEDSNCYPKTCYASGGTAVVRLSGTQSHDDMNIFDELVTTQKADPENMTEEVDLNENTVQYQLKAKLHKIEFQTKYGPFRFNEKTPHGRDLKWVEVDVTFPSGLYSMNDSGDYQGYSVEYKVTLCHDPADGSDPTCYEHSYTASGNSTKPIRRTHRIAALATTQGSAPNWYVTIERVTKVSTSSRVGDKMYIARVKALYGFEELDKIPDCTLLWCKAKATNSLASLSAFKINGWFKGPHSNLGDVVRDLYTNKVYGGGLPESELMLPARKPDAWVHGVYDKRLTVFDAIRQACEPHGWRVYPVGPNIKIRKDQPQSRKSLFNEATMVKGSFRTVYTWDHNEYDSVKVEWFDSETWAKREYTYPDFGVRPKTIRLFGVTRESLAMDLCRLYYNRNKYQGTAVEFKTDSQGWIPQLYDRIGVTSRVTNWGTGATVLDRGTYDGVLFHSDPTGEYLLLPGKIDISFDTIIFRDPYGNPSEQMDATDSGVVGSGRSMIHVPDMPDWVQSGTVFSIGTSEDIVRDFVVTSVEVQGDARDVASSTLRIRAVKYDERIYE